MNEIYKRIKEDIRKITDLENLNALLGERTPENRRDFDQGLIDLVLGYQKLAGKIELTLDILDSERQRSNPLLKNLEVYLALIENKTGKIVGDNFNEIILYEENLRRKSSR